MESNIEGVSGSNSGQNPTIPVEQRKAELDNALGAAISELENLCLNNFAQCLLWILLSLLAVFVTCCLILSKRLLKSART